MAQQRSGFTGPPEDRRRYLVPDITRYRRGGVGVVFEAKMDHEGGDSGRPVGLKMLTGIDEDRFAKLMARSDTLSKVEHPHLARHIECFIGPAPSDEPVDEDECDQFFSAHVWVNGRSLSENVPNGDVLQILRWGHQVGTAIDFLHSHTDGGLAHRDIHARNIIITPENIAVLIDYDTILWGDSVDTNIVSLASSGGSSRRGLGGAQASDTQALAAVLLRCFANDPQEAMAFEELPIAATPRLQGIAKDPKGVISRLRDAIEHPAPDAGQLMRQVQARFDHRASPFSTIRRSRFLKLSVAIALTVVVAAMILATIVGARHDNSGAPFRTAPTTAATTSAVEADDVAASDLPTVSQVAAIYPAGNLARRDDLPNRGANSAAEATKAARAKGCVSWTDAIRSTTGISADYADKKDEPLFFKGLDSPTVTVYQFSSEQNAQASENIFTAFVKRCQGDQAVDPDDPNGEPSHFENVSTPKGYQGFLETYSVENDSDDGTGIQLDPRANLEIVSRKGAYLIRTWIQAEGSHPNIQSAIELAKLAHAMAGPSNGS
jgi:hypothetical protein